jgi:hypothetical protein
VGEIAHPALKYGARLMECAPSSFLSGQGRRPEGGSPPRERYQESKESPRRSAGLMRIAGLVFR